MPYCESIFTACEIVWCDVAVFQNNLKFVSAKQTIYEIKSFLFPDFTYVCFMLMISKTTVFHCVGRTAISSLHHASSMLLERKVQYPLSVTVFF